MTKGVSCVLCALAFMSGCALFNGEASDAVSGMAAFPAERLDRLDLAAVHALFPEGSRVSVERFDPAFDAEEDLTGGVYAYRGGASVTVRVYASELGAASAMRLALRNAGERFVGGDPTEEFPLDWWYQQGPPASILFACRNVVVLLRSDGIKADAIASDGLDAATAVVRQLRKAAGK